MDNEIKKYQERGLTTSGKAARSTDDEIKMALAPMFVEWPDMKFDDARMALWCFQLRDIRPDVLARAVMDMLRASKYQPTVAAILEQIESRPPGPRSESSDTLPMRPVPQRMFRLPEDEDRQQRMEQLKRTEKWSKYYG